MIVLQDTGVQPREPKQVASLLQQWFATLDVLDRAKEHLITLILDTRMQVRYVDVVAIGTLDAVLVCPREVFRRAITLGAAQIILAHNHPSQVCEPSDVKRSLDLPVAIHSFAG
jgi:DNA repair protein RadC